MQEPSSSLSQLLSKEPLVLIDFFATWCGPCQMMGPILQEVKQRMGVAVKIIKIDIDKNTRAAQTYFVQSVPTLVLFKNGQIVWRQSGVIPANQLIQIVQKHQ